MIRPTAGIQQQIPVNPTIGVVLQIRKYVMAIPVGEAKVGNCNEFEEGRSAVQRGRTIRREISALTVPP
jgi:hypothetical protein